MQASNDDDDCHNTGDVISQCPTRDKPKMPMAATLFLVVKSVSVSDLWSGAPIESTGVRNLVARTSP